MHLLIVEDEAIIARDLVTTIKSFGHVVVGVVDSGEEAMALAAAHRPDLVLMDIHLSGPLDGITTAQQLQAPQPIPVVYLTAHTDDQTMRRAAATHPVGYLLKPFDERALWSMLEIAAHQQQITLALQAEIRRIFQSIETCGGCSCDVLPPGLSPEALCMPLAITGETLGVLHVHLPIIMPTGAEGGLQRQLALALGEQAALGLADVRLRATLREQSIRDPLTGLFNRRYLEETLTRELHRAARNRYPVGVIMLDIDHFKQINDTYGHEAGDTALRTLGALLLSMVRAGDVACRYGGEEFVLILPATSLAVIGSRAEAIRHAVGALEILHGDLVLPPITVSLGTSVVADAQASVTEALARADAALYRAKRTGRNCVVAHTLVSSPTV